MTTTYIAPSRRGTCTSCSKTIQLTATSASKPYCLDCRKAGHAPSNAPHGSDRRYGLGCRCESCYGKKMARIRAYNARKKTEGAPSWRTTQKACVHCSQPFVGKARQKYCTRTCAQDVQGRRPDTRFRITPKQRAAIHEKFGYICQLCESPTDPSAHFQAPRYPTLDHIIPRSRGGSDEAINLRTACRECNTKRGAPAC